jgi:8-oxo-dGTP pyrophosphatase MutT (NUDIX family)
MPISPYVQSMRNAVGMRLLLLPAVAGIIRDADGRVLLQRRADDGGWGLPAGAIDPGETPADAVIREVYEETGLEVRPTRVIGVFGGTALRFRYPNGDEAEYTTIVFACEVLGGTLECRDGECIELRFFEVERMPSLDAHYPRALFEVADRREALFVPPVREAGE